MSKVHAINCAVLILSSLVCAAQAAPEPGRRILLDNTGTDSGRGVISQDFGSSFEAYDAAAADDFEVPPSARWTITQVDVTGRYFDGLGPADSESVTIYQDTARHRPGAIVAQYVNVMGVDSGEGSFQIPIPPTRLQHGRYWLSVVVNMPFETGGEWAWENMLEVHGFPPEYESPNGRTCTRWEPERKCFGPGLGDHFFVLEGRQAH